MRTLLPAAIALFALTNITRAQTLGIPCCNDYTINTFGSGTTSCTFYTNPPASPLVFAVDTANTATSVFFFFSCQCLPASIVFPGCCGVLNFVDIDLSCLLVSPIGPIPTTPTSPFCSTASLTVPFCPPFFRFVTQALIIDPTCPVGFRITQAYDVLCL